MFIALQLADTLGAVYVETSARSNAGIDDAFLLMARAIMRRF